MKLTNALRLATLAAGVIALSGLAQADGVINGQVWENTPNPGDASDPANRSSLLPNATFVSSGINYCSSYSNGSCLSAPYDVSDFLNNPTFNNQQNGFNPLFNGGGGGNWEVELTGSIFLTSGANPFDINHDDGLTLTLSGGPGTTVCDTQNGAFCVDQPGPTGPALSPFTITASATGTYNFVLDYSECCTPPAVLQWTFPTGAPVGSVPEPRNTGLFLMGVLGLAMLVRRKLARA